VGVKLSSRPYIIRIHGAGQGVFHQSHTDPVQILNDQQIFSVTENVKQTIVGQGQLVLQSRRSGWRHINPLIASVDAHPGQSTQTVTFSHTPPAQKEAEENGSTAKLSFPSIYFCSAVTIVLD
jgi:hypothetical protein